MVGLLEPAGRHRSAFEASDDRALPIDNCRSRSTGIVPSRATVHAPSQSRVVRRYVRRPPAVCVPGRLTGCSPMSPSYVQQKGGPDGLDGMPGYTSLPALSWRPASLQLSRLRQLLAYSHQTHRLYYTTSVGLLRISAQLVSFCPPSPTGDWIGG